MVMLHQVGLKRTGRSWGASTFSADPRRKATQLRAIASVRPIVPRPTGSNISLYVGVQSACDLTGIIGAGSQLACGPLRLWHDVITLDLARSARLLA